MQLLLLIYHPVVAQLHLHWRSHDYTSITYAEHCHAIATPVLGPWSPLAPHPSPVERGNSWNAFIWCIPVGRFVGLIRHNARPPRCVRIMTVPRSSGWHFLLHAVTVPGQWPVWCGILIRWQYSQCHVLVVRAMSLNVV